jgi:protein-tyrosine-phosphatase
MKPTALVLDGHCPAALETTQSLGRHGVAAHVAATTLNARARRTRHAAAFHLQPLPSPPEAFADWLRALHARHAFELIVPATEASLLQMARLPEDDPLRRLAVVPGDAAIHAALDKQATWELARRVGTPIPQSRLVAGPEEAATAEPAAFPVVLKPIRSKIMKDGALITLAPEIVRDAAHWRRRAPEMLALAPMMLQEYAPGAGVGVELLFDRGQMVAWFAHRRLHEWPLTGGASTYRESFEPPAAMLEGSRRMLEALGWHGAAMVEFKLAEDGRFWLMEINPRLWGSLALSIDAGVDFPWLLWQLAHGQALATPPAFRRGHRTRSVLLDLNWTLANLRADRSNPLVMARPRLQSALEWLRVLAPGESWDFFDWRDPWPVLGELATFGRDLACKLADRPVRWLARRQASVAARRRFRDLILHRGLAPASTRRMLFVCYGNICRSPFAETLARQLLPGHEHRSAGFHRKIGRPSPQALAAEAAREGVDVSAHRSRSLDREAVDWADLILVMDLDNAARLGQAFPDADGKTLLLGAFERLTAGDARGDEPIDDPYQANAERTREVLQKIRRSLQGLADWLAGHP